MELLNEAGIAVIDALDGICAPIPSEHTGKTLGTGLCILDKTMGGGLRPREMCLLMSPRGGETTDAMLNFMLTAAYAGYYSLTLSLEMPAWELQSHLLRMAAGVPVKYPAFPSPSRLRAEEMVRVTKIRQQELAARLCIADYSMRRCTSDGVVSGVGHWVKLLEKAGVRDKAGVVCIDSANFIDVPGCNNSDTAVAARTIRRFKRDVANAFGVRLYVAAQDCSPLGRCGETPYAQGAFDFGIRFEKNENAPYPGIGSATPPKVDLRGGTAYVLRLFRSLVGNTPAFTFYQSPTLRMYNSQCEYREVDMGMIAQQFSPAMRGY